MKTYKRLRAVVNLDAIRRNLERMQANLMPGTHMIAVIKTDGYGHGAEPIAHMLEEMEGIWGYAVALPEEGYLLRRAGIQKPILCLGCTYPEQYEETIAQEIRMTVYTLEAAREMAEAAKRAGKPAYVHVKLDTGMSRLGFPVCGESAEEIAVLCALPGIVAEGLFSHFAKADETDKAPTEEAYGKYCWMRRALEERGIHFPYYHVSNSATIIDSPDLSLDLVRAGIAMYGLYPSQEVRMDVVKLEPALELKAHITHVKWIEKGTQVSYGGTFTAPERMRVATVPAGYGDGYPRSLSGKGCVLIHGKRAPILGRVCMDQFMVNVTHIPETKTGDEAVLAGRDGEEFLSVEELSGLSGRFNYEFVCCLNKRVPREYIRDGRIAEQVDYF